LPAGLTREQFFSAMRHGKVPRHEEHAHQGGHPVLQVMPWPRYQHMTDEDIGAIYEYLRVVPHADAGTCSGPAQ